MQRPVCVPAKEAPGRPLNEPFSLNVSLAPAGSPEALICPPNPPSIIGKSAQVLADPNRTTHCRRGGPTAGMGDHAVRGCRPLREVERVLEAFHRPTQVRDGALFLLGVRSGFRISEILSLRVRDDLDETGLVDRVTVESPMLSLRV